MKKDSLRFCAHVAAVAAAAADRPVVLGRTGSMTYGDLEDRMRRIAAGLRRTDLRPGDLAAVDAARTPDLLSLILGAFHAGLSVLLVEVGADPEAAGTVLRDAGAACLLCADPVGDRAAWPVPVLAAGDLLRAPVGRGEAPVPGDGPAWVTRTTGTTGKSVLFRLSQRAVLFHAANYVQALELAAEDRVALVIPPSAGASTSVLFGTLLAGATLCLFDPTAEGFDHLAEGFRRERVTAAYFPASLFRAFAGAVGPGARFPTWRVVKLGGEPVEAQDVRRFRAMTGPRAVCVNGLGVTDVGGNICFMRFDRDAPLPEGPLPVGRPVEGLAVRIVDEAGRDAAIGEIVVRGPYLAEPVGMRPGPAGEAEVRTGDVGRWLPDGTIQYVGRTGDWVKIRGQRAAPAETDRALRTAPGVRDAATIVSRDGESCRLVAFVEADASEQHLGEIVRVRLSPPQVPARIVVLERLPRLSNGKVDRTALAGLLPAGTGGADRPAVPEDPLERQIWDVWRSILRRPDFDCTNAFASLGGDSLRAAEMLARLSRITGCNVPLTVLHDAPTIRLLAAHLRAAPRAGSWNVVVELSNPGSGLSFLCIPGAGADVESLRGLAERLGRDRPVVGLRMPGTDGAAWPPDTIEGILKVFLPAIRRYQPQGPYLLGGSSFGGVIAYELAARLVAEGARVAAVVLLDSYTARYPRPRPGLRLRDRIRVAGRCILPITNRYEYTPANVKKGLRERFIRTAAALQRRLGLPPRGSSAEFRYLCLVDAALRAHRRYQPAAYGGRLDLYRCESTAPENLYQPDPSLGWHAIAAGEVAIHAIGGRHGYHLFPPHVDGLAQQLQQRLHEAEQEIGT